MLDEEIAGYCLHCAEEVPNGEPCVTVNLNVEIRDSSITDVKNTRTAVMLCTHCGQGVSDVWLRQAVAARLSSLEEAG